MKTAKTTTAPAAAFPDTINLYGETLTKRGVGLYPYECVCKDKYPNAMIYYGVGSWSCSASADAAHLFPAKEVAN